MAYLLFIPVVYYGTSHVANKLFSITSDYVLESEELHDDSNALLTAVTSVLERYKDMKKAHPAFNSKVLVEEGMDSLKYMSINTRERWYQRNYHNENSKLKRLQDELERRLRLFLLVTRD